MIGHIIVLSRIRYRRHTIWSVLTVQYCILRRSHLYNRSLSNQLFVINRILSDRSWQFNYDFSVDRTYMINHAIVPFVLHHIPYLIRSIMIVQFHFLRRVDLYDWLGHYLVSYSSYIAHSPINLYSLVSYSTNITLVRLIMSLSYLLFMIGHIISNRLWWFSFDFLIDCTYTITHIIMSSLRHRSYPVVLVMTIQFRFRRKANLYEWSCRCPVSSSS